MGALLPLLRPSAGLPPLKVEPPSFGAPCFFPMSQPLGTTGRSFKGSPRLGALRVAWWTGQAGLGRLLAAGGGLWLSVMAWVMAAGLARGIQVELVDGLLRGLPATEVRVSPRERSLGILQLGGGAGGLLGGRPFREDRLEALRSLPGVEAVHPRMISRFPVGIRAEALGQSLYTDAVLEGITAEELARESKSFSEEFRYVAGQPVPVLAPEGLLTLFNEGIAPGAGIPRLSPRALEGLTATLTLGKSSLGRADGPPWAVSGRLLGTSRRISTVAAGVPLDLVREGARRFGDDDPPYSSAVIVAHDAGDLTEIVAACRGMGLEPTPEHAWAEELGKAISFARSVAYGLGFLLAGLASLALLVAVAAGVRERLPELALLRALGASRRQIRWILVAETLGVGFLGGLAGTLSGLGLGWWVGGMVANAVEARTGVPLHTLYLPDPSSLLLGVTVPLFLSIGVGASAARRAARLFEERS